VRGNVIDFVVANRKTFGGRGARDVKQGAGG